MTESQNIQEVRRLIGTLKKADERYKEEENNAKKIYESECNDANIELKTINEKSGINLAAAKGTLKNLPSHELVNHLEFKIHKKTIEESIKPDFVAGVEPTNELKKNASIAIEISQKIDERVKELHRLINVQKRNQSWGIAIIISALILVFSVAKNIYISRQIKLHYAVATEALKAKNWGKAFIESRESVALGKNFKDIKNLYKEYQPTKTVLETMEFVWIPGGCFNMGSLPNEGGHRTDEEPVHEVCVDGFWMGKTEVTNEQFRKWNSEHNSGGSREYTMNNDDQPVAFVSWYEAKDFPEFTA